MSENEERRLSSRVNVGLSCHFSSVNKTCAAETVNLSMSGALIRILEEGIPDVEPEDLVECQFTVFESLFVLVGELVRVEKDLLALHFRRLNTEKVAILKTIIETYSD